VADAALMSAYDGVSVDALSTRMHSASVFAFASLGSTLDEAHTLAANGAPAGTVIVADEQTAGRGRVGRSWTSRAGGGVWCTVIERPTDARVLELLSLRVGLALAPLLEALGASPVSLKWPNDLFVDGGKVAGVLTEARWQGSRAEWVAIGVGINVVPPGDGGDGPGAALDAPRHRVLEAAVQAIRAAAATTGLLTEGERAEYGSRDLAAGRTLSEPLSGIAAGVAPDGSLLVRTPAGEERVRAGSLRFADEPATRDATCSS